MNPIRDLRKKTGRNQTEAAALAGVCQQQWSRWERAPEFRKIEYDSQRKIAEALGTNWVGLHMKRIAMEAQDA